MSMLRRSLPVLFGLAFTLPASASFHLIKVLEVFPGAPASPNAQYVVLQAFSSDQNFVGTHSVIVYAANGTEIGRATFSSMVSNGADQMRLLIATTQAQTFFGVTADLLMSPIIPAAGGKVCWDALDCVSWGGYSGSTMGVGTAFNAPVGLIRGKAIRRRLDICNLAGNLDGCDDTENSANDFRMVIPAPINNANTAGTIPGATCGNSNIEGIEQCDDGNTSNGDGCSQACLWEPNAIVPASIIVDASPGPGHNGNGVFEIGESLPVLPSWMNSGTSAIALTGNASLFTGPSGPTYSIGNPSSANYGTLSSMAAATCTAAPSACYSLMVSGTRPSPHWDSSFFEVLSNGSSKEWKLHIGQSFTDVPSTNPFYKFVETILHKSITAGCTANTYCPENSVTRAQMAIFLLTAKFGSSYTPPAATGTIFQDVPANAFGAAWIEDLYNRGVTGGCVTDPLQYCPGAPVTRAQMSVFLLRTNFGNAYTPPPATGVFGDVPADNNFAPWIEALYKLGITGGCQTNPMLYCPASANTRGQMSVFLTKTFNLSLYAP